MYFYFFVAALEIKATRPVLRAVAPFITAIQIVQMVVGLGLCLYAMYLAHYTDLVCETPYWLASSGAAMYFLYFVLFAMFFAKKYSAKDKKDASKKPKRA
jgi:elongation of very long chain fatty acids protein 6